MASVLGLCLLSVSTGSTGEYHFAWDPNPNEQLVEFKIYYRTNSSLYNATDFEAVRISDPIFDPSKPDWKIILPDVAEEYCFSITAVYADGAESALSDEIGTGTTCGQSINNDSEKDGSSEDSKRGRCFILQGILQDKRWDSF